MADGRIGAVVLAAFKASGSYCVITAIGIRLAWTKVLDRSSLKAFGALGFKLLMPCLYFTMIAGTMSAEYWREFWGLVVLGGAQIVAGLVVGRALVPFSGSKPEFRHWFVIATALPNTFGIPLVYIEAICRMEHNDPSAAESCIAEGNKRLLTFCVLFPLLTYGFGGSYALACRNSLQKKNDAVSACSAVDAAAEVREGEAQASNDEQRLAQSNTHAAKGLETAAAVVPEPTTESTDSSGILAASHLALERILGRKDKPGTVYWQLKVIVLENPPVLSVLIGIFVGLIGPLQGFFFGTAAPLQFATNGLMVIAKATPGVLNLLAAASLGLQLQKLKSWTYIFGGGDAGISRRTVLLLVFAKMLVMPAIVLCLLLQFHNALPADRWFRLLLFIEAATPTANNVVVLANVLGEQESSELLALTTIAQFAVFVPISTLITAVGLGLTDHLV